ncbi:retropepsin-like aspartic protease [Arachidicoccus ginsenosidivorans]
MNNSYNVNKSSKIVRFKRNALINLLLFTLLTMLSDGVLGQRPTNSVIANRLEVMTKLSSADTLKSLCAENFSVGAYSGPSALSCLQTLAKRLDFNKVRIKKSKDKYGHQGVKFISQKKATKETKGNNHEKIEGFIAFNDSGKILFVDLFDKMYGMDRNAHSRLVATIPFESDQNGSIILQVKLNKSDRVLKLLFDTGADGMALSKSLADSIGIKSDVKQSASVVGGNAQIEISRNNTVHLGDFSFPHQSIALFDKMDSYDGIMGNALIKQYITKVDYDNNMISLYSFGDFDLKSEVGTNGHLVNVTMPSGLVIISGNLSVTKGKMYTGDFVFDLGAAYSLICFRPFVKHNRLLVDGFQSEYMSTTRSLGMITPTFTGAANSFQVGDMPPINDLTVTLMSGGGQSESWNPGFDGSIGSKLISKYNFIIDMQAKQILFSPNHSFHYPKNFIHSGMLFGFSPDGKLYFLHSVGTTVPKDGIEEASEIIKINGLPSQLLRDQSGALQNLLEKNDGHKWTIECRQNGKIVQLEI